MKIIIRFFLLFFLFFAFYANGVESLKNIKHESFGFEIRVPNSWLLSRDDKSIRYSTGVGSGKFDIKHWPKKNPSKIADALDKKFSSADNNYRIENYAIGEMKVVSFFYKKNVKSKTIFQEIHILDTKAGAYVIQFASELQSNNILVEKVLSTFRVF